MLQIRGEMQSTVGKFTMMVGNTDKQGSQRQEWPFETEDKRKNDSDDSGER